MHSSNDSMATLAFTCGILGFCCLPASIVAIIAGSMGRGPGATVGLVLGLFNLGLTVLVILIFVALAATTPPPTPR